MSHQPKGQAIPIYCHQQHCCYQVYICTYLIEINTCVCVFILIHVVTHCGFISPQRELAYFPNFLLRMGISTPSWFGVLIILFGSQLKDFVT